MNETNVESLKVYNLCVNLNNEGDRCYDFVLASESSARIAELERELEIERGEVEAGDRILKDQDEEIAQLRADVERLKTQLAEREEDRWQPIETAPKDGTEFQGWMSCSARWVPQMRWSVGHERWEHRTHDRWILLYPQLVTHWQPLPKPPAIRAARAQEEEKV